MRRVLAGAALLLVLAFALPAGAVEPSERLADPVLEARARHLSESLRCLVCQNETIDESNADLAHDLRVLLRERIKAGDSDAQAVEYLTDRYGNFVLLDPPVEPATYVLWFGPLGLLLIGGIGAVFYMRRRKPARDEVPLSAAEQARLDALLHEGERR